jgi:GrpB-like predicted nucleotidyltransferase (UPF0157 family)
LEVFFGLESEGVKLMKKHLSEMTLEELWELFPIFLTEHQLCWDSWYHEELCNLQQLLPAREIVRISHIGSTAVKLIWAKPIVDILVETTPDSDWEAVKNKLLQGGYLCMLENNRQISLNKGYTENGFAEKVYHLHLRREGDNDELYFRDYLLDHLQAAKAYEELKLNLWKKYEHNRDAYTESKTDFIQKYTQEARKLYGRRYDQNPRMERGNGLK